MSDDATEGLETRRDELAKRLAAKQAEKGRYVRLYTLRERVAKVEEDTQEAFRVRRQLVRLLVPDCKVGKSPEDGKIRIRITYRFGEPGESSDSFIGGEENGSLSYLTKRSKSGKNLLVVTGLREKEAKGSPSPLPGSRNVISTFSESNSMAL